MNQPELDQLIAAWLDGRIDQTQSEQLQELLRESSDARARFWALTRLDAGMREIASSDLPDEPTTDTESSITKRASEAPAENLGHGKTRSIWAQLAVAAVLLVAVGATSYQIGRENRVAQSKPEAEFASDSDQAETTIAGHATLRRSSGIRWSDGMPSYRQGDVVPAGLLAFDEGVAEVDFFCGATVVVEGPAKLLLESDWTVRCLTGRLRASVPPAAQGFIVKVGDSEIVDLGTEFALEVGEDKARVEVVEGEVKLQGGKFDGDHLVTGEGKALFGQAGESLSDLSTIGDVQRLHDTDQRQRFLQWLDQSRNLRRDNRLIAYYPIAESKWERFITNEAATGNELDGKLVGLVEQVNGRFGAESVGLEFDRPGARVRTRIEGEFDSYTFACWVRIDSLEHTYNAIFMGDGYENGEPHWQIQDDGSLMFSVMVDDTPGAGYGPLPDARLHHIYRTEPFWDVSKSGQWFHIAAVYDPANRRVTQFINGQMVASEGIQDQFFVSKLRIGAAEIGNWGQPTRKSPWFAVRNLHGAIDELAIFDTALRPEEIQRLYEQGKPLGYE